MKMMKFAPRSLALPKTILGLFFLFVLAASTGCGDKDMDASEADTTNVIAVKENNITVAAYVNFIANDDGKMSLNHEYTNEALLKLTAAIGAVAGEVGFDIKRDMEQAKVCANNITNNPFETSHADDIRKSAEILSGIMQNIQLAKYPGLAMEAGVVKSAAAEINPEVLTLDQQDAVKSFFVKSANLLQKMN